MKKSVYALVGVLSLSLSLNYPRNSWAQDPLEIAAALASMSQALAALTLALNSTQYGLETQIGNAVVGAGLDSRTISDALTNLSSTIQTAVSNLGGTIGSAEAGVVSSINGTAALAGNYAADFVQIGQNVTSDIQYYVPQILQLGNSLVENFTSFYNLAENNLPQAQQSLAQVANALSGLAHFAHLLEITSVDVKTLVAVGSVLIGGIALGIVAGKKASKYVFTTDGQRSVFVRAARWSWIACKACYSGYQTCFRYCFPGNAPEGNLPASEGNSSALEGNNPASEGSNPAPEGNNPAPEGNSPAPEGNSPNDSQPDLEMGNIVPAAS